MEIEPPPVQDSSPDKKITDDAQMIADLVTGLNMRKKDNKIQGYSVLGGTVLGSVVGLIWGLTGSRDMDVVLGPVLIGFFGGALGSLLISGAILGVYRTFRH